MAIPLKVNPLIHIKGTTESLKFVALTLQWVRKRQIQDSASLNKQTRPSVY